MTQDRRERVARAICSMSGHDPDEIVASSGQEAWRYHMFRADAAIAAYEAALKEEGLVVVPKEPTIGMCAEGRGAGARGDGFAAGEVWKAMLEEWETWDAEAWEKENA